MNLVDAFLALVIVAGAVMGWRQGLLAAAADVIALAAGLALAFFGYSHLVALMEPLKWGVWTAPAAFFALLLLGRIALGVAFSRSLKAVPPRVTAHPVNRALGTLPGIANGLVTALVLTMVLLSVQIHTEVTRRVVESAMVDRFTEPVEWLEAELRPVFEPALQRTADKLTVQPGSVKMVKLPFTVENPKPRADLEAQMLELVNAERRAQRLPPLAADPDATKVARKHSTDMFRRGYFSHLTPEGGTPVDRMRAEGVRFLTTGENLALARTLPMAHKLLMESPPHREAILHPTFRRVGIGIMDGGRHGIMVTQNFRN